MNYDTRYPGVADLKVRARKRMPRFAFDYVDGGIDQECCKRRNRQAWQDIELVPRYLRDVSSVDTAAEIFGHVYDLPIGIGAVGLGNMMWPGAELALARAAQKANIPYTLSTFSTTPLEEIARAAPDVCWFQLYVPRRMEVMEDLLGRVKAAGYRALVVTLDVPVGAKRNRELKNGLKLPFSMSADIVWQSITHPRWALATLAHGRPDFVNVLRYREGREQGLGEFITNFNMQGVTLERVEAIRQLWDGPLLLKGAQHAADIQTAADLGVDGVIISNHAGRQLDAAPATAETLRGLSWPDEKPVVMVDSGIRTGLDVVRARAIGAKMAFSGRSFFWGVGAMGAMGAGQVIEIYRDEIVRSLKQIGCSAIDTVDSTWLRA